ncbi:MAG: M23 family metallopeptidase [Myxococcota bacterium]
MNRKQNSLGHTSRSRPRTLLLWQLLGLLIVLAAVAFVVVGLTRSSPQPQVNVSLQYPAIGPKNGATIRMSEGERGLSSIRVELQQGAHTKVLAEESFVPRAPWDFFGDVVTEHTAAVELGKEAHPELVEGEATLRVTTALAGNWLRSPEPLVTERQLPVRLTPPLIQVQSEFIYAAQGRVELVVYQVGESATKDGVEVDEWFFPGFPLPGGGPRERFALFAIPYYLDDQTAVRLMAEDELGNRAVRTDFLHQFFPRPLGKDTIQLNDRFMAKVVTEILPRSKLPDKGDLLQNYLQLNGELRRQNGLALREMAARSEQRFLWREPFLPMRNAAVKGAFADRRTYLFEGKSVDTQDHLGFDLASVSRAPIEASNDGKVLYADYFGIYGNCVVIDHGYGLMTLYAHLSSISVSAGEEVRRGQEVGRSGATGLAGGDHLHFTTALQGLPVNPIEWWDAHWIQDRLKRKLGDALPFSGM